MDGVRGMARSTVFQYKGTRSWSGPELGVDHIVTGVLSMHGQYTLHPGWLVDARNGSPYLGTAIRAPDSTPTKSRTISHPDHSRTSSQVRRRKPAGREAIRISGPRAFRLYLKDVSTGMNGSQGLVKAIDYFSGHWHRSRLALAYSGLADSYTLLEYYANVPSSQSRAIAHDCSTQGAGARSELPRPHLDGVGVRKL